MTHQPDVVVLGGGPAGSTAATLLAQHGHRVTLLDRDKFPRYHVGESLMPDTYWVLRRLGALDAVRAAGFVQKQSARFTDADDRDPQPFYFFENNPHDCSQTWQVRRDTFDDILLRHSHDSGVDVREETLVLGATAGAVRLRDRNGREETLTPRVIVDATGPASFFGRGGAADAKPTKACVWNYFKNAPRESGPIDAGATLVVSRRERHGGFWHTPLADNLVSVGVVAPDLPGGPEAAFWREVENCPAVKQRLAGAEPVAAFRTATDTTRSMRVAGDGWTQVGDAVGFFDPLFSSGVHLALRSASMAADAVNEGLRNGDLSANQLGKWGPEFYKGRDRIRRLADAFHDGFRFGAFVRDYPTYRRHLLDLLFGDVFKDMIDELWPAVDACTAG